MIFFCFSSRRRHTRLRRDWSQTCALPICLKGIISERDYAREVILKGRSSKDTLVGEIMSTNLITVPSTQSVDSSLAIMSENHIRHLPIVDDDTVVGVLSLGDLVKDVINDQQSTIEQLENYIRG